jgi:hypothetical protein
LVVLHAPQIERVTFTLRKGEQAMMREVTGISPSHCRRCRLQFLKRGILAGICALLLPSQRADGGDPGDILETRFDGR